MSDIYNIDVKDSANSNISMSEFAGKTLLIVNVASKCGLTPQYEGLQKIYDEYKDRNFVVLGFPCNQFGGQEPGTDQEIGEFCDINYSVTFPIFSKIKVNGPEAHPLFKLLKALLNSAKAFFFLDFLPIFNRPKKYHLTINKKSNIKL